MVLPANGLSCVRRLGGGGGWRAQIKDHDLSHSLCNRYIITTMFDGVLHCFCFVFTVFVWCPCMAINVSVQYNGGLLPDIILLTQCYYHRGTRSSAMKRFCICSL